MHNDTLYRILTKSGVSEEKASFRVADFFEFEPDDGKPYDLIYDYT